MTQEQLKEMRDRVQHLHRFLKIEDRLNKLDRDRQMTLSPGFWDDNARATGILKEIKIDSYWTGFYDKVKASVEDFAILYDFWKEGEASEEEVKEAYKNSKLPNQPNINFLDKLCVQVTEQSFFEQDK